MQVLVNIDVNDLAGAVTFYCNAFGLTVGRRFGTDGVELLGASSAIYLLLKAEGTAPSDFTNQKRTYRRHWSPIHLDFVVPEIEPALQRAVSAGATLEKPSSKHSGSTNTTPGTNAAKSRQRNTSSI